MNKQLRSLVKSAHAHGRCLVCGSAPCRCAPQPTDLIGPDTRTVVICNGQPVQRWHVCDNCKTLIGIPDNRPAVRCPHCHHVN